MPHTVKRIARINASKLDSYIGPEGELLMDTTNKTLVLETGSLDHVRMAKESIRVTVSNGLTGGGTLAANFSIAGVNGSLTTRGVVQLSNSISSVSETLAATPKAVYDALTAAKNYAASAVKTYTGNSPISVSGTVISVSDATTSAKGVVQLSSSINSTSETLAATPKAVKDALDAAKAAVKTYKGTSPIQVSGTTISVLSGTTGRTGVVQLSSATNSTSETLAATPKAVKDALDAAKAYTDANSGKTYTGTSPIQVSGTVISVLSGTTSRAGVVQLSNAVNSTSTTLAATPYAVKQAYDLATSAYNKTATLASHTLWGQPFNGTQNVAGQLSYVESIEFNNASGHGGYLDFHYPGSSADYTSRIIENRSGVLTVNGTLFYLNRSGGTNGVSQADSSQNGFTYLSNGMLVNWGYHKGDAQSGSVSFRQPFTLGCSVVACVEGSSPAEIAIARNGSKSYFRYYGSVSITGFCWIAIGY